MRKTVFSQCQLGEGDFSSLKAKDLSIRDSDLTRSSFLGTMLSTLDLRGSDITGIFVSDTMRELRGARLDVPQLIQLSGLLGIELI